MELAAAICGCPIALVSIVGAAEQRFIARTGLESTGTSREVSFCQHAIMNEGLYEVTDATVADQFKASPLVTGDPHIKFYAAIPIDLGDGMRVGLFSACPCLREAALFQRGHERLPHQAL